MKLSSLLADVEIVSIQGDTNIEIRGLANDSRQVKAGFLFVAIKGFETDGHLFWRQALANGAEAILVEADLLMDEGSQSDRPFALIRVENARLALAKLAMNFYGRPTTKMDMVGITGTNGKTSTSLLTYHIMQEAGKKTGVIGTISNFIGPREIPAERTTPEAHELEKLFAEMVDHQVDTLVMEVSSHALDLYRVAGIRFKIAAFTNLSLDHLDFHKTMENYLKAKSKLFQMAEIGVVNLDDPYSQQVLANHTCKQIVYYSLKNKEADFFADQIDHDLGGSRYRLHVGGQDYKVSLKTPGNFSVYNSLAAIAITYHLGIGLDQIIGGLEKHSQVKGRFQAIPLTNGSTAIVDYAHTPDGLENVLRSIQEFKSHQVITVFGCGGDRDKSKRPLMAKIAEEYSDLLVVTSDNPRTEEPQSIIQDVVAGLQGQSYLIEVDRKKAIEKALAYAGRGDIVLIAGKGHEDYQIIGKEKFPFDDGQVVREWEKNHG